MSHIADLIAKHCPNGVDEKLISDVATLERGKYISKKTATPGDIPVIAGGRGPAYWHNEANRTGELLTVAGSGAYAGFVQYWDSPVFVSDAFSIATNPQLNTRFLYHWLKNKQDFLHSLKKGSGVAHVYPKDIAKLQIPVPPLEVQAEIVRILDSFTNLEANLQTELEARRQQYEYYRDLLLKDAERCASWSCIGDISLRSVSGGTPLKSKSEYYGGNIPWLRTQEIHFNEIYETENYITKLGLENSSAKWVNPDSVVVAISGATAGRSAIIKKSLTTNQHCAVFEIDSAVCNYRYVYYWLANKYLELKSLGRGARGDLNLQIIKNFQIPVPPLAEQERIVAILDKFDALVNDLSCGLPAEIAARRKQYEYYRDQLLTFTPAN